MSFVLFVIYKTAPVSFFFKKISPALLIGYNNIHPIFFYIFLSSASIYLLIGDVQQVITLDKVALGALLTLVLGGLWGAGNSAWGFFWVNDSIEILLLKYICLLLLLLHTHSLEKRKKQVFMAIVLLVMQLLILRWGLVFTRHSFFNLNSIVNISKLFIFFFNTSASLFGFFFVSIDRWVSFVGFFMMTYILALFLKENIFAPRNIILHTVMLVLTFSWLKIKPHNLTLFIAPSIYKNIFFVYSATAMCLDNFLVNLSADVYAITRGVVNYAYFYKVYIGNYIIYQNWSRFFLVIIIASMWKI